MKILVLNSGSSSLRFKLFEAKGWQCLFKGHVDGIGLSTCRLRGDIEKKIKVQDHRQALEIALLSFQEAKILKSTSDIKAIGHRVVHGGEKYQLPLKITPKILRELTKLNDLAPLHNPPNLAGISACFKLTPLIPNIAVFDTGFHTTLPETAFLYGLPYKYYQKHQIRKYGFHGTSHSYVSKEAIKWLKHAKKSWQRIITCHIGNGISVTAIKNGKSLETSMGFTPLEGVMMGTRTGDFDPSIILHLINHLKMDAKEIDHLLNHESGLKGLSGISSDMRPLWGILQNPKHQSHNKVKRAYDVYVYRLAKMIASYTVPLGGIDALIFTAGIGENAWYLRRDVCAQLLHFGLKLDVSKNRRTYEGIEGHIHAKNSAVSVLVIPTDEELQIAKEVKKVRSGADGRD